MILSPEQVQIEALRPTKQPILSMREDAVRLRRNYYGEGLGEYLTKINQYENEAQFQLRKKFAETNRALMDDLLRPLDNLFSAKGGARVYKTADEKLTTQLIDNLTDVRDGEGIQSFMKFTYTEHLMTNPGGLIWMEKDQFNQEKARLTIKGIGMIKNYEVSGIIPQFVVFEPHEVTDKYQLLYVVDDVAYYLVRITKGKTTLTKEEKELGKREDKAEEVFNVATIESFTKHLLTRVPGVVISPITDSRKKTKISPIEKQMELFDLYSVDNSVKQIYQFLHGYPRYWEYLSECPTCKGTKLVDGEPCPDCKGTGRNTKKDVSDILYLKRPNKELGEDAPSPDVAGYVQPDLETWREMRVELEHKRNRIYYSLWGTLVERKDNETATGRFIDTQPVHNKLSDLADTYETVEAKITYLLGKFYLPNSFQNCWVTYGRRFMIETPDQVWDKYLIAKEKKAPIHVLDLLLEQFYQSEYKGNPEELAYYLKLIRLEPFVHYTVEEVKLFVDNKELRKQKYYFGEWIKTVTQPEVIIKNIEQLTTLFNTYLNSIKDDAEEVSGV